MLALIFIISLILLPGIIILFIYREKLEKYIHRILAFAVFITTGLFIFDILHPNVSLYAAPPLESAFTLGGIAIDSIVSSFLLTFLIGTCWAILRIELAQEKLDLVKPSRPQQ